MKDPRTILKAVAILFLGLFSYSLVFQGDWIWDDESEVTRNEVLPDPSGLPRIWKGEGSPDYLPVKTSVQWFFYRFAGENATPWHLLNISLHLLDALLVWKLFAAIKLPHAWLGGLIFVAHPLAVESVAWISEFKNTLSLAFLLLSMLAYLRFIEQERWLPYFLAFALYVLALLSKGAVVMYPFVILLYVWFRQGRITLRDAVRVAPFFGAAFVIGLVTIHFQFNHAIKQEILPVGDAAGRTVRAGAAVLFYFWKTVFPLGLIPGYPRWQAGSFLPFLAWPLIFAVLVYLWTKRLTWGRPVLLGLGFFLLNLFPVLGFIPMSWMRISWVGDHFVYLPMIGLIGLAVWGAGRAYDRFPAYRKTLLVIGGCIMGLLTFTTHGYAGIFVDETALWTYTLDRNPDAWHAHHRIAMIFRRNGDARAALFHDSEAVRLRPDLAETRNNYAVSLQKVGDARRAVEEARETLRLGRGNRIYKNTYGDILIRQENYAEAEKVYEDLVKLYPRNADYLVRYAVTLYSQGRDDEALPYLQQALAIEPDNQAALTRLRFLQERKAVDGKQERTETP